MVESRDATFLATPESQSNLKVVQYYIDLGKALGACFRGFPGVYLHCRDLKPIGSTARRLLLMCGDNFNGYRHHSPTASSNLSFESIQ